MRPNGGNAANRMIFISSLGVFANDPYLTMQSINRNSQRSGIPLYCLYVNSWPRVAEVSTQCVLLIGLFRIVSRVRDFGSRCNVTFPIPGSVLSPTYVRFKRDTRALPLDLKTHVRNSILTGVTPRVTNVSLRKS